MCAVCEAASDGALYVQEDDIIGLLGQHAFERQDQARFRKTRNWLGADNTRDKLLAVALSNFLI